ncbi:MAG: tetratricopeptide repeat protein [Planctomycetota bacterium]|jgi:hypothetical protein
MIRPFLGLASLIALFSVLGAAVPVDARADDYGYGCGCGSRSDLRTWGGPCGGSYLERRHVRRFAARGGSWVLLRRGIRRDYGIYRHGHPRNYFLRRWRCDGVEGFAPGAWRDFRCADLDRGPGECPVVEASLEQDAVDFTSVEYLARGLERFYRGAGEEAEADFEAALALDPDEARARYGLLVCAVLRKDWKDAAGRLRDLASRDLLHAGDRLAVDGIFEDPKDFDRLLDGLAAFTQWNFHEADAQLVAGWAFASVGETAKARGHLRSALRFRSGDPAAERLMSTLGEEAPGTEEPTGETAPEATPVEVDPSPTAPNLAQRDG